MNNKGLAVGLVALVALLGIVAFLAKGKPATEAPASDQSARVEAPAAIQEQPAAPVTETPAAQETATTADVVTPPAEAAPAPESVAAVTADTPAETAPVPAEGENLLAAPAALTIDVEKAMAERVLGNPDAPVTIIEYASMTCSHCAYFHNNILSAIKKELIDTGKARIIFRDFPLDQFAMKAAMMARCADADKYFNLSEVIFSSQERWVKSEDPVQSLSQLGTLAGMDEEYIKTCVSNPELEHALLAGIQDAQSKYDIKSTPTFIFNNGAEQFSGAQSVEKFIETVNKLSAGK